MIKSSFYETGLMMCLSVAVNQLNIILCGLDDARVFHMKNLSYLQ